MDNIFTSHRYKSSVVGNNFSVITKIEILSVHFFTGRITLSVESQGFVDKKRGRTLHGRSRAYIRVNGRDYSKHKRGFNVVVLNGRTGKDLCFEIHGD